MALNVKVGQFTSNTVTGNQTISGLGFTPTLVILFCNDMTADGSANNGVMAFGFGNASASWSSSFFSANGGASGDTRNGYWPSLLSIVSALSTKMRLSLVSFGSGQFVINIDVSDAVARKIQYIAFGGDLSSYVGATTSPTSNGTQALANMGFQPKAIMTMLSRVSGAGGGTINRGVFNLGIADAASQAYISVESDDNTNPTDSRRKAYNDAIMMVIDTGGSVELKAERDSMDLTTVTLEWLTTIATAIQFGYLGLGGNVNIKVGRFTMNTTTGQQTISGVGFTPKAVLAFSRTNAHDDVTYTNAAAMIGASDGSNEFAIWMGDDDNVTPANVDSSLSSSKFISARTVATAALRWEADLLSFNSDGYVIDITTATGTPEEFYYIAFGDAANVQSTSLTPIVVEAHLPVVAVTARFNVAIAALLVSVSLPAVSTSYQEVYNRALTPLLVDVSLPAVSANAAEAFEDVVTPGTIESVAVGSGIGQAAWVNPTNAGASDNSYTTFTVPSFVGDPGSSHHLKATNLGLAIPSDATIRGVKVEYERKSSSGSTANDSEVKLVIGGAIVGSNKSTSAAWSTTEGYVSFGGSTDLWGNTISPAQANASDFGAVIRVNGATIGAVASIDHIRITVYYSVPETGVESTSISPIVIEASLPAVSRSFVESYSRSLTPIVIEAHLPAVARSYQQPGAASLTPIVIEATLPPVTTAQRFAAALTPIVTEVTLPPVATAYVQIGTAALSPIVVEASLPAVTVTARYRVDISPIVIETTLPPAVASYYQINSVSISPIVIDVSLPAVAVEHDEVYSRSLTPLVIEASLPAVAASYQAVIARALTPIVVEVSLPPVTPHNVATTALTPLVVEITLPPVSTAYVQAESTTVAPIVIDVSLPAVTASYGGVYSRALTPIVTEITLPPLAASARFAAALSPIVTEVTLPPLTGEGFQVEQRSIAPIVVEVTPVPVIASHRSGTSLTPIIVDVTLPPVTTITTELYQRALSPIVIESRLPPVTTGHHSAAALTPLVIEAILPDVSASYLGEWTVVLSPIVIEVSLPPVTAEAISRNVRHYDRTAIVNNSASRNPVVNNKASRTGQAQGHSYSRIAIVNNQPDRTGEVNNTLSRRSIAP